MSVITIKLAPTELMGEFFFKADKALDIARDNLARYITATHFMNSNVSGIDAAEELFDLTNNPSRQEERIRTYGNGRSISVGDIVNVDGVDYLCMSAGWEEL